MKQDIWDPNSYTVNCAYVSKYGEELLNLLHPKKGEKICDVGCGTGDLAKKIAELGAHVVGIDSSLAMVEHAKKKQPNVNFLCQNVELLTFKNEFDAVFSNAALHWVKNPSKAINSIWRALKNGGRFVAELGGKNNIARIVTAINSALDCFAFPNNKKRNPWTFLSTGEYVQLLEKTGFIVREVHYYDRPTQLEGNENGLRNWIDMFAPFFFTGVPANTYEEMLLYIENESKEKLFSNNTWSVDYTRLRIRAEKA